MNCEKSAGIGGLNTSTKNNPAFHNAKTVALAAPRAAFLGLVRLNVWGIASLLKKQAFLVNKATTDASKMGQYYWDVYKRWDIGWYNLGGKMSALVNAINAGYTKRPLGINLAPKNLRAKLAAKGISGIEPQGIGEAATLTTVIGSASVIIGAFMPLIMMLINNSQEKKIQESQNTYADFGDDITETDSGISPTTMGAGLVGVAILAALFIGTKKSKK